MVGDFTKKLGILRLKKGVNKMHKIWKYWREKYKKSEVRLFKELIIVILFVAIFLVVFIIDFSQQNSFKETGEISKDIYNITEESNDSEDISFFRRHMYFAIFIFVGVLALLINSVIKFIKEKKLAEGVLSTVR